MHFRAVSPTLYLAGVQDELALIGTSAALVAATAAAA
jgi:hypothetical protein